jgi:hypothetical protein
MLSDRYDARALFQLTKRQQHARLHAHWQIEDGVMKRQTGIACAFVAAITLTASIAYSQTNNSQTRKADQQFMNEATGDRAKTTTKRATASAPKLKSASAKSKTSKSSRAQARCLERREGAACQRNCPTA